MKKKLFISAMLVCLLALGLALVGCDNGTTSSPEWWEGYYSEPGGGWANVSTTSITSNLTSDFSGSVTITTGGNLQDGSGNDLGNWVYIFADSDRVGIVVTVTGTGSNDGVYVGLGNGGVNALTNDISSNGGVFSPSPASGVYPTEGNAWISGKKQ
jgi:hypothetical protein